MAGSFVTIHDVVVELSGGLIQTTRNGVSHIAIRREVAQIQLMEGQIERLSVKSNVYNHEFAPLVKSVLMDGSERYVRKN